MRWTWVAILLGSCVDDAACDTAGACLDVPDGWQGPVAMVVGEAPACSQDVVFLGVVGLEAAPATCECACEPERQPSVCDVTAELAVYPSDSTPCADQVAESRVELEAGCTALPTPQTRKSYTTAALPQSAAGIDCAPIPTVERPEPTWTTEAAVCDLAGAPFDAKTCIWVDGDLPCPGGDFSERTWVLEGIDDGRGCTECRCGDAMVTCDATVDLHTSGTCTGIATAVDGCVSTTYTASASLTLGKPTASCEPSKPTPTGSVGFVQDHTVCCLP